MRGSVGAVCSGEERRWEAGRGGTEAMVVRTWVFVEVCRGLGTFLSHFSAPKRHVKPQEPLSKSHAWVMKQCLPACLRRGRPFTSFAPRLSSFTSARAAYNFPYNGHCTRISPAWTRAQAVTLSVPLHGPRWGEEKTIALSAPQSPPPPQQTRATASSTSCCASLRSAFIAQE